MRVRSLRRPLSVRVLARTAALFAGAAGGAACRPPGAPAPPAAEATLTYAGGLAGRAHGLRLWEDRAGVVRAAAFGGRRRLAAADTAALRAALGALEALAAAPPDTVSQDSAGVTVLCADVVRAEVRARRGGRERRAADGRCRGSAAEGAFRRAADAVYARLTVAPGG